jgi:hypothetical protein
MKWLLGAAILWAVALAGGPLAAEPPPGEVTVSDGGSQIAPAVYECTPGHRVESHRVTLDSGAARYTFLYRGCTDPSHGELRPAAEGNFGMPEPSPANWYWGGFLNILINGKDATLYRLVDLRAIESGRRGAFQVVWAHPDAEVGLRLLMLPGANHVMAQLVWKARPQAALGSVALRLTCYPSFFTAARHRRGDRHCQTPRTDRHEPETLELAPDRDAYLYYYDTVFDRAKGEGDGPCAALLAPGAVQGGRVQIGDYAVITDLALRPKAGQARLAFYDFTGRTNAEAQGYLKAHAAIDRARLAEADFRPESLGRAPADRLPALAEGLLTAAGDDARPYRAKMEAVLRRAAALQAPVVRGDWKAEADLAALLDDSADLFWKLKALALLNNSR